MADIQAISSPRISDSTLRKLLAFAYPKQHTDKSTYFDMGYERCKQDLLAVINHEVGGEVDVEIGKPVKPEDTLRHRWWGIWSV